MNKLICIVFLCMLYYVKLIGNPIIVECSHYSITIRNNFKYSLVVYIKKGRKTIMPYQLIPGGGSYKYNHIFTKKSIKKMKIYCAYTEETYKKDINENNARLESALNRLNKNKEAIIHSTMQDFFIKIGFHAASTIEPNSDDNMMTSFLKWVIQSAGKVGKGYYTIKEGLKFIETKEYNNYEEFFVDLISYGAEKKFVDDISSLIEKELGIKQKTNAYVINAILYLLQQIQEVEARAEYNTTQIQKDHQTISNQIDNLKNDQDFEKRNSFIVYDIANKPLKMKTITPNFSVSVEPIIIGNRLNDFFGRMEDGILKKSETENKFEWTDGLWNNYFGGSAAFAISPEIKIGKNSYSRLYALLGYHHLGYKLDTLQIGISNSFFKTVPSNSAGFTLSEPIRFEQTNLSGGIAWRFFIKNYLIIDLSGGYIRQNGILNLSQNQLSDGYSWVMPKIKIVDNQIIPFGSVKLGLGKNKFHAGTHFSVSANLYKPNNINNTEFMIFDAADKPINFSSRELQYNILFGITQSF